jgi:hypothetical protein
MPVQPPDVAPDFELDHILGHKVSLGDFRGRKAVITFGGRESVSQIENGISAIRKQYGPDEIPIVGISDLRAAPRPARIIVKNQIKKAFEGAVKAQNADLEAAGKPPSQDPAKDVIMLLDWSGEVTDSFGVTGAETEAAAVAIDGEGKVRGSGSGEQLGQEILAVLGEY